MTVGIHNYCIAGYIHCLKLLKLFKCIIILEKIESIKCIFYLFLYCNKTRFEHPVSKYSMSGGTLLLELSKHSCIISIQPFRSHQQHYPVAIALSCPEWNDFLLINVFYLIINPEENFFPRIKNFKIVH